MQAIGRDRQGTERTGPAAEAWWYEVSIQTLGRCDLVNIEIAVQAPCQQTADASEQFRPGRGDTTPDQDPLRGHRYGQQVRELRQRVSDTFPHGVAGRDGAGILAATRLDRGTRCESFEAITVERTIPG